MKQKLKLAMSVAVCLVLWGFYANAQTDNREMAKPIPLLADEESDTQAAATDFYDPAISYYVQNLDLSPEQLDLAQQISIAEQKDKDEIMQHLEMLKRAADTLEATSLHAFEAILDDEQKIKFHELRAQRSAIKQGGQKTPVAADLPQSEE